MRSFQKWLVWFVATFFFSFQFVLRLLPGLVMPEIMSQFQIGATEFGILSAFYYLGYSGMQIPAGLLLDKYPVRNVIISFVLAAAAGVFIFAFSKNWYLVILGRFLLGVGSAAGFLGAAKVIRTFFKESEFTFMVGLTFSLGLAGALYGGKPTSLLIENFGWHQVSLIFTGACLLLAILMFFTIPKESGVLPKKDGDETHSVLSSLRELLKYPKLFWIALAGALMVGPLEGFADVWGVSYLINVFQYSKSDASLIISLVYFGMLFGGPVLSWLAERYQSYYSILAICGILMAALFGAFLFGNPFLSKPVLAGGMVLLGVLCCYQVLVFGVACQTVPSHLSGLTTSVANCINMVAGSFFHISIGTLMDLQWSGQMTDGVRAYESQSYLSAISIIPIMCVFGFIGFLVLNSGANSSVKRI